jgi:hypothetical protein
MESVILPYLLMSTVTAGRAETIATQREIEGGGGVPLQPLRLPTNSILPTNLPTGHGFSYIISILPTSFLRIGGGGSHPHIPRSLHPCATE